MTFKSIEDIKAATRQSAHSKFWFSAGTLRFFSTKIESEVIEGNYFVTSERDSSRGRRYTVRHCDDTGEISTVGGFMEFSTAAKAKDAAYRAARGEDI